MVLISGFLMQGDPTMTLRETSRVHAAHKAIDRATSYHGPVVEPPPARIDPSAPTVITVCVECGKESCSHDGERMDAVVRKPLHVAGVTGYSQTAKSKGVATDTDAYIHWLDCGKKPHPVFSRAAWLAIYLRPDGTIRSIAECPACGYVECKCKPALPHPPITLPIVTAQPVPNRPYRAEGNGFILLGVK